MGRKRFSEPPLFSMETDCKKAPYPPKNELTLICNNYILNLFPFRLCCAGERQRSLWTPENRYISVAHSIKENRRYSQNTDDIRSGAIPILFIFTIHSTRGAVTGAGFPFFPVSYNKDQGNYQSRCKNSSNNNINRVHVTPPRFYHIEAPKTHSHHFLRKRAAPPTPVLILFDNASGCRGIS